MARFAETEVSDDALRASIQSFCAICEILVDSLYEIGQRKLAEHAVAVRRRWLVRLALDTRPLPALTAPRLPAAANSELSRLRARDGLKRVVYTLNLSEERTRGMLSRILSEHSTVVGLSDAFLVALSSTEPGAVLRGLSAKLRLGGYDNLSIRGRGSWSWTLRVRTEEDPGFTIDLNEADIPREVNTWLVDFSLSHASDEAA